MVTTHGTCDPSAEGAGVHLTVCDHDDVVVFRTSGILSIMGNESIAMSLIVVFGQGQPQPRVASRTIDPFGHPCIVLLEKQDQRDVVPWNKVLTLRTLIKNSTGTLLIGVVEVTLMKSSISSKFVTCAETIDMPRSTLV